MFCLFTSKSLGLLARDGQIFYVKQIKTSEAMKKFLMLAIIAMFCQWGYSQYQPGDYYQEDDLDCMVIHVNEEDGVGLIMTLPEELPCNPFETTLTIDTSSVKKMIKSANKIAQEQWKKMLSLLNERSSCVAGFYNRLGLEGKKNHEVIRNYCKENGIDYSRLFPEYALVDSLGEGWFIPGKNELDFLADLINVKEEEVAETMSLHKRLWNCLWMVNDKIPIEKRSVFVGGLTIRHGVNKMLLDFINMNDFGQKLSNEIADQIEASEKKAVDRLVGYSTALPFNMGISIRCSSLHYTAEGWLLMSFSVMPQYKGAVNAAGFVEYSGAYTCAVKEVNF